jgi:hypothetical protein
MEAGLIVLKLPGQFPDDTSHTEVLSVPVLNVSENVEPEGGGGAWGFRAWGFRARTDAGSTKNKMPNIPNNRFFMLHPSW